MHIISRHSDLELERRWTELIENFLIVGFEVYAKKITRVSMKTLGGIQKLFYLCKQTLKHRYFLY